MLLYGRKSQATVPPLIGGMLGDKQLGDKLQAHRQPGKRPDHSWQIALSNKAKGQATSPHATRVQAYAGRLYG